MSAIGIDVGGANLKFSDGETSISVPFAMWRTPERLAESLRGCLANFAPQLPLAVTMTGELADCFSTKAEGVTHIVDAVCESAESRPVAFWQTVGEFVDADVAKEFPMLTAAANWHALATWAGRLTPRGTMLLIDVGSTTTDLIPVVDGSPMPRGRTDLERLQFSELIYLGVRRTPLCGLATKIRWNETWIPLAREHFATTLDVGLLLGTIVEDSSDQQTANGRAATVPEALQRMARMFCADLNEIPTSLIREATTQFHSVMRNELCHGLRKNLSRVEGRLSAVLTAGEGSWLAEEACRDVEIDEAFERYDLTRMIGPDHSQAACAFALSQIF
ncbi:MAG: hypothetical protein KDA80_10015 [Planctomycetaceae bacterium]|nr:hypothetical protein [Planctomycetaceae bacterium]